MDLWKLERDCWTKGHDLVCGCDEAGLALWPAGCMPRR